MVIALGFHLFPFRTEKLSPITPMVLRKSGRVGSRRFRKRRDSVPKGIGSFFVYKLSVVIVKTRFSRFFGSVDFSWGLFFILVKYCLLRIMKNDYLAMLASLVLPAQILDYFLISGVEQSSQEIHISLDEKMNTKLSHDVHFESKGFMESVNVTDFPIRDHKVILKIRRRRWTDLRTGKSFSIPIDLDVVAKGTRYSKEFGAFLKETYGDIPSDLPYA